MKRFRRLRRRARPWLARLAALAVAVAPTLPGAASAQAPVVPPGFVDPHLHVDKPDLSRLRVLRFLTTDDEPPFGYKGPDGTLIGFNVDLTRAICAVLDVPCSIEVRRFEDLVRALQAGAGDAVIGSLAITEASRRQVDFSRPTMRMAARFVARTQGSGTPLPDTVLPETVGSLVIGVQAGTAHEAYLRRFFPRAIPKLYMDPDSLRGALKEGAIDLAFSDGLSMALWLNGTTSAGCCRFAGGPFTESRYFGEGTGVAVRKGDATLRQALDFALLRLSADGILTDLQLKYMPVGFW